MTSLLFFAQASAADMADPNGPVSIGTLVIGLGVLAGIAVALMSIFRRDPPLHREFASKQELEALSLRVDSLSSEIGYRFDRLDEKRSESIGGLHQAVDDASRELRFEMHRDMAGMYSRMTELVGQVQKLIGRIEK